VEGASGKPLDQFFEERIFRPLGMKDTAFFVPEEKWNRLAVLYTPKKSGGIEPSTAPPQENFKRKPTLLLGGAGTVSTLDDYARFIDSSADHVVNAVLKKLWRDPEYRKWRNDRRNAAQAADMKRQA